jgi:xanthine dehydrogenase YagR molybdenum-binding subunit
MTMIGQPINRVDGPLKVSGQATYAYEHWDAGQPLYGFILGAAIGRGRITAIDTTRAEQSPGVRLVMTYRDAPAQGTRDVSIFSEYWRAQPKLSNPEIHHYGEPVALVVATTFEQARAAAHLVDSRIRRRAGKLRLRRAPGPGVCPESGECRIGDRHRGGRFRVRVRHRRGQNRPALHDAVSILPADGAECLYGGTARR